MSTQGHTGGNWTFRKYSQSDAEVAKLRSVDMEPTLRLSNDGEAYVSTDLEDAVSPVIAAVRCQTEFKRGKGWQTECAEREANARLIAAAPDMIAELKRLHEKHGEQATADIITKAEGRPLSSTDGTKS